MDSQVLRASALFAIIEIKGERENTHGLEAKLKIQAKREVSMIETTTHLPLEPINYSDSPQLMHFS